MSRTSVEEHPRELPELPEHRGKIDAGVDVPALQNILAAVGTLAAEVKELKAERGFPAPPQDPRLFGDLQDTGEPLDATKGLRRARAAAGGPPANLGDRLHRRATDGTIPTGGGAGRPPEPPATTPSRCWRS